MTVDYTHILSFDPIIHGRRQSDSIPSLAYGVKMPGHSCDYGPYWNDSPLYINSPSSCALMTCMHFYPLELRPFMGTKMKCCDPVPLVVTRGSIMIYSH